MKSIFAFLMVLAFSMVSLAVTKEEVQKKTTEAMTAAVDYSKEQKEQFQKEMETKVETLKVEIGDLKKKALETTGHAQKELNEHIAHLEAKQRDLSKNIASLKKSTGKSWEYMKTGISKAWDSLSESYEKAKNEFKK